MDVRVFWGKAGPNGTWQPAVCHMIDTGQTAAVLLERVLPPSTLGAISSALGGQPRDGVPLVAFLCALHDLGKVSAGFQQKDVEHFKGARSLGLDASINDEADHTVVTVHAVNDALQRFGIPRKPAEDLARALAGHHGTFPALDEASPDNRAWQAARVAFTNVLADVLGVVPRRRSMPNNHLPAAVLMTLAGLTSVSDWIASDVAFFPFAQADVQLKGYAAWAKTTAKNAVEAIGWSQWRAEQNGKPRTVRVFGDAFFTSLGGGKRRPWQPNAVQNLCAGLAAETKEPFLLIVETPTGTGKTEAALWAADISSVKAGQTGLYYALSPQAASHQMFARLRDFLSARYPADLVKAHLLHGGANLNEVFQELRASSAEYDADSPDVKPQGIDGTAGEVDAAVSEWFCGPGRALLSPFALGPVDQALLGAMTTRHMFVRLFALSHKVVVIDEVHAYDTHRSALLEPLIRWLWALGSTVIVLSATLPAERRRALMAAYSEGRAPADTTPYPRIVRVTKTGKVSAIGVTLPPQESREIALAPCRNALAGITDALVEKLRDGGCAAVICNTVGHAQAIFQRINDDPRLSLAEKILFHGRFPVEDRLGIEKLVLDKFSRNGNRPRKAVVVATQIIEQNLDIDFDFMVTELAPLDLMLQRCGRLHRHADRRGRPDRISGPEMQWLPPLMNPDGTPRLALGNMAEGIYEPYILFRSLLLLQQKQRISIPADVEEWIEFVYSDEISPKAHPPAVFKALQEYRRQAELLRRKESQEYGGRIMPGPGAADEVFESIKQYVDDDDKSAQILTRLSRPAATIICAHNAGDGLSLTPDGKEAIFLDERPTGKQVFRLLQRSVKIEHAFWYGYFTQQSCPPVWSNVPLLRSCRLAIFQDNALTVSGRTLRLDPIFGLSAVEALGHVAEGEAGKEEK